MKTRKSSEDRRAEILATTLILAFEVGPDHVTTGMIAERLGLTQPAIYKHFPKKEDIWQATTEKLCARIRENIRRGMEPAPSPVENLRLLILGHLQLVTDIPALPEIMVTRDPTEGLAEVRRAIQAEITLFRSALAQFFEAAQAEGHLSRMLSAEDGVMLLFGIIQSLVLRLIITRNTTPLLNDGQRLFDLQIKLLSEERNAV